MNILVLCTGNSCRSQMAQGFLQSFDQQLNICSAGTEPAKSVNEGAIKCMAEIGLDISQETPKNVAIYLDKKWDFVITVCGGANESCPTFTGSVGQRLHIGFDDPSEAEGSSEFIEKEFRRVRDEIKQKMQQFYLTKIGGCCCKGC